MVRCRDVAGPSMSDGASMALWMTTPLLRDGVSLRFLATVNSGTAGGRFWALPWNWAALRWDNTADKRLAARSDSSAWGRA